MLQRIIKQYTDSLFNIASKKKLEKKYLEEIEAINQSLLKDESVKLSFYSINSNFKNRENILKPVLLKYKFSLDIINFILILNRHNRIFLLPKICEFYLDLIYQSQNKIKATVIVSQALNEKEKSNLLKNLSTYLKKELIVSDFILDKSILGGIIVKFNNYILDASISSMLNKYVKAIG